MSSFWGEEKEMGFGIEASVDCGSDGSPVESYYSSWSERWKQLKKYLGLDLFTGQVWQDEEGLEPSLQTKSPDGFFVIVKQLQ